MAERRAESNNAIDIATSALDRYNGLVVAGKMPLADAQRAAMDDLREIRYDGSGAISSSSSRIRARTC